MADERRRLEMVFEVLSKYQGKESADKLSLRLAAHAYQKGREDQKAHCRGCGCVTETCPV